MILRDEKTEAQRVEWLLEVTQLVCGGTGLKPRHSGSRIFTQLESFTHMRQRFSKSRCSFGTSESSWEDFCRCCFPPCGLNVNVSCHICVFWSAANAHGLSIKWGTLCLNLLKSRSWIFIRKMPFWVSQLLCLSLLVSAIISVNYWLCQLLCGVKA